MVAWELQVSRDGYLGCPCRGEISVEWCAGCPFRRSIERADDAAVVVCEQAAGPVTDAWIGPLRDVPAMWS